jgi:hypothetical protein
MTGEVCRAATPEPGTIWVILKAITVHPEVLWRGEDGEICEWKKENIEHGGEIWNWSRILTLRILQWSKGDRPNILAPVGGEGFIWDDDTEEGGAPPLAYWRMSVWGNWAGQYAGSHHPAVARHTKQLFLGTLHRSRRRNKWCGKERRWNEKWKRNQMSDLKTKFEKKLAKSPWRNPANAVDASWKPLLIEGMKERREKEKVKNEKVKKEEM